MEKLLIANRGEIAVRIARTAAELGIATVAVHARDDATALHVRAADSAVALRGDGVAAYLDIAAVVRAAVDAGCDAIHLGYGFLSENAAFAQACADAEVNFAGPTPTMLTLFGDKTEARALARAYDVPLLPGTAGPTTPEQAREFLAGLGPGGAVMVKALAGGGGRGLRAVERIEDVEEAVARCCSEAQAAFGRPDVYVERLVRRARHVEVQVAGDGTGAVVHLWERDCTLQRCNQKLVEMAPAVGLPPALHGRLLGAAVQLAQAAKYASLGTFEFLVDRDAPDTFAFMEANPRLQVEYTVTEEITGLDLVALQLRLAEGRTLAELGLTQDRVPAPHRIAVQVSINVEAMQPDGSVRPAGGTLIAWEPPAGPGIRFDGAGYSGWRFHPGFDSLIAKLIVHVPDGSLPRALARASRALGETRTEGLVTNAAFLRALLARPEVATGDVDTRYVEVHAASLLAEAAALPAARTAVAGA
ncbi:MAG: carbamoyl-phosphate synthase large subunit, partial [Alphaproteobacteria bacterium]|nr:carbamoyl-phosphate synthase large subunit [Alphaproteobacteria bacterium]